MGRDASSARRGGHDPRSVALAFGGTGLFLGGMALSALFGAGPAFAGGGNPPVITSAPASPSNNLHPSWSFTQPASPVECELVDASLNPVYSWASCSSPASFDLTGQPDGTYTFYAATGAMSGTPPAPAANDTSSPGSSYTLDTTAPAAPTLTSSPSTPGNSRSPSWSFTHDAGATTTCQLSGPGGVLSAYAACTSPVTVDLTGQADGTYTLSIVATDTAGNASAPTTSDYALDTTPPASPTISSGPTSPGNSRSPSWSFTHDPGSTTTCQLSGPSGVISAYATCSSPASYDLTGDPDGTYTLSVIATDTAGNASAPTTSDYTLDTTAPAAPTISSGPTSPGNSRSPSWSFTHDPGSTTTCQLSGPSGVISAYATCSSPAGYDLTGDPDGTYTLSVIATDTAGNASAPTTSDYTLDTTAPAAPTISSGPTSPGNSRSPSWSFTHDPGSTTTCQLSGPSGVISAYATCSSPASYDLTGDPDGTYTLSVIATDTAGNASVPTTSDYQLLTTPPVAPTIISGPAAGSTTTLAWGFTTAAGTTTSCQLTGPGGGVLSAWGPCTSPVSFSVGGSSGTYTMSVRATDAAGNVSTVTTATFRIPLPPAPGTPAPGTPATPPSSPTSPPAPVTPPAPAPPAPPAPAAPAAPPFSPIVIPPAPVPPPAPVSAPVVGRPLPPAPKVLPLPVAAPGLPPAAVQPPARVLAPVPAAAPVLPRPVARPAVGTSVLAAIWDHLSSGAVAVGRHSGIPFLLLLIVLAFLIAQDRIDRNDPKLAMAPIHSDPDLEFPPPIDRGAPVS